MLFRELGAGADGELSGDEYHGAGPQAREYAREAGMHPVEIGAVVDIYWGVVANPENVSGCGYRNFSRK